MAFEPKTWACGDTITAQELNRIEQGIVEASDKGYECVIGEEILFDGVANVVSGGEGMYNWQFPNEVTIDADSIEVVFNGTSYNLNKQSHQGSFYYYGEIGQTGPAFTTYPFLILVQSTMTELYVPNRGDYNIKVSSDAETVETSECFKKAVKSVGGDVGYECSEGMVVLTDESATTSSTPYNFFSGSLSYDKFIDEDEITVGFEGVEYTLQKNESYSSSTKSVYGAVVSDSDISTDYPFGIESSYYGGGNGANAINTPQAGTYSVKISKMGTVITATECFEMAVKEVLPQTDSDIFSIEFNGYAPNIYADKTFEELARALYYDGKIIVAKYMGSQALISEVSDEYGITTFEFIFVRINSSVSYLNVMVLGYRSDGGITTTQKKITLENA